MTPSCNDCRDLKMELWPKGVRAARCFSERAPRGTIRPRGRTLEVFTPESGSGSAPPGRIARPVWCPRDEQEGTAADEKQKDPGAV